MAGLFKREEVELTSETVTTIDSASFAKQVRDDKAEVVQHLSEVIGPISPSEISVDQHGKVVINNKLFASAAEVMAVSPLDNILCNHHLICNK